MKANGRVQILLRELRLPREERGAARLERRVEEAMRSQRDNVAYSNAARGPRSRQSGGAGAAPAATSAAAAREPASADRYLDGVVDAMLVEDRKG